MTAADFRARYGPWAIVAGASEGLGAAWAEALAARGLHLVLVARREEPLAALAARLAAEYKIEAEAHPFDLAQPWIRDALRGVCEGREVGMLVYNAAAAPIGAFLERSAADHGRVLRVNARAPMNLAHEFGRAMVERRRGGIILVTSLASLHGTPLVAHYAATKAYLRVLAEGLWDELRPHGVDVCACWAGTVTTPRYEATVPERTAAFAPRALDPRAVVEATLHALGRRPFVIPGVGNRLAAFVMERVLPRRMAVALMGRTLRRMYGARHTGD